MVILFLDSYFQVWFWKARGPRNNFVIRIDLNRLGTSFFEFSFISCYDEIFSLLLKPPTSDDDHVFDVTFYFILHLFFCICKILENLYLPGGKTDWLTIKQHGYYMFIYRTRNQALTLFLIFMIFSLIRDQGKNRTKNIFIYSSTLSFN